MTKADKLAELLAFVESKKQRIDAMYDDYYELKGWNAALDTVAEKIKEIEAIKGEQHT